jgi:thiamine biosynthesis protein ThiS
LKVVVNGEEKELPAGVTAAILLEILGLAASRVAVERNCEVIPRGRLGEIALAEGDRVEVVRFVGGGH